MTAAQRARTAGAALSLVVLPWAAGCGAGGSASPGAASDLPVITVPEEVEDHPTAQVVGALELRQGCLLLGGDVVFWPHGTTWDAEAEAVVFADAPQFEDAAPARVGTDFSGGGGSYAADTDFRSWRGDAFADPIEACRRATGATAVVYAYPATSD